jgi:hypothetical protein
MRRSILGTSLALLSFACGRPPAPAPPPPAPPTAVVECPAGADRVGDKCEPHVDETCADGTHLETGKGCVANVAKSAGDLAEHWIGEWKSKKGFHFSFAIDLEPAGKGAIHWTLRAAPGSSSLKARIGDAGTELVEWSWDAATRELHMTGTKVDDPTLLATDEYKLHVAADGKTFTGKTKGNLGDWKNEIAGKAQ